MTTIQRQIQQEIKTLPEYAQKQVFNFVLSLKKQEQSNQVEQFSDNKKNQVIEEREDWINTLPEMTLTPKEQQSLADSRKEQGKEMTIEEFQAYLKNANV